MPWHDKRVWTTKLVHAPEQLADDLQRMTWCGCNAWELAGYLWLNDSTGPDGAQEYAVVKIEEDPRPDKRAGGVIKGVTADSVTVSWCSRGDLLRIIDYVLREEWRGESWAKPVEVRLDAIAGHRCGLCA